MNVKYATKSLMNHRGPVRVLICKVVWATHYSQDSLFLFTDEEKEGEYGQRGRGGAASISDATQCAPSDEAIAKLGNSMITTAAGVREVKAHVRWRTDFPWNADRDKALMIAADNTRIGLRTHAHINFLAKLTMAYRRPNHYDIHNYNWMKQWT